MNGPIKMYQTKRRVVHHDFHVEIPKCMYSMKNIHARKNGMVEVSSDHVSQPKGKVDIFQQNNLHIPGMAELEAKQEDILKQLAELKKQILSIKSNIHITSVIPVPPQISTSNVPVEEVSDGFPDIIVNSSPKHPPYSLGIIQKLLEDTLALVVTSHLHSSISSLTENAVELEKILLNFKPKLNIPKINVRLIWKKVEADLELRVSHVPILGEVNLLRYLARVIMSPLSYHLDQDSVEVDSLLDICYLIVRAKTKTERASLLQPLNKSLGKSQWLVGRSQPSMLDIAAYSAIKQTSITNELNANLVKWFQRCDGLV